MRVGLSADADREIHKDRERAVARTLKGQVDKDTAGQVGIDHNPGLGSDGRRWWDCREPGAPRVPSDSVTVQSPTALSNDTSMSAPPGGTNATGRSTSNVIGPVVGAVPTFVITIRYCGPGDDMLP